METAVKQYEEMKSAFMKLDDARYSLNKVMGPGGSMTENERKLYLRPDIAEHDKLLQANRALPVSTGPTIQPPRNYGQQLQNNPSRAYFNQAGIGGQPQLSSGQYNQPDQNAQ